MYSFFKTYVEYIAFVAVMQKIIEIYRDIRLILFYCMPLYTEQCPEYAY